MNREEFSRAIRRGLGRAILFLRENPTSIEYHAEILKACIHNTVYDQQCEPSRAPYLFDALMTSGALDSLRPSILAALMSATDRRDKAELFQLAGVLAAHGDAEARMVMYAKFEKEASQEAEPSGERAIVELDGIPGLMHVMECIGRRARADTDFIVETWVHQSEIGDLDQLKVRRKFREASQTNELVRAFRERIIRQDRSRLQLKRQARGIPRRRKRPQDYTYDDVKSFILGEQRWPEGLSNRIGPWRWGRLADDESISRAASDLLTETDTGRLTCYLRIFSNRAFPLAPDRILELARSDDQEISKSALRALCPVRSETVRELGVTLLRGGRIDSDVIELLQNNYQAGDANLISAVLPGRPDDESAHDISRGLLNIFKDAFAREHSPLLHWVYENTPCALCRADSLKYMIQNGLAARLLLEEAIYDSLEETRKRAATAFGR